VGIIDQPLLIKTGILMQDELMSGLFKVSKYRLLSVVRVETDINTSITMSPAGSVIMWLTSQKIIFGIIFSWLRLTMSLSKMYIFLINNRFTIFIVNAV
jgi:hypothetical protein